MVATALVQDTDDNLGKYRHMERVIFFLYIGKHLSYNDVFR